MGTTVTVPIFWGWIFWWFLLAVVGVVCGYWQTAAAGSVLFRLSNPGRKAQS